MLGVVETYRLSWSDVMHMPFRTFIALQRHAATRSTNERLAREFNSQVQG